VSNSPKRRFRFGTAQAMGGQFAPLNCSATGAGAGPGTNFASNGGGVLSNVHLQLIFWGVYWNQNPVPAIADIESAVQIIVSGPYMDSLNQYGVGRGSVRGTTIWPFDPPVVVPQLDNPGRPFTFQDAGRLVTGLIDGGTLPEPDEDWQLLHCVFVPPYATFTNFQIIGQNGSVTWNDYDLGDVDNDPIHFLWVGSDGTLDYITTVLSHELAEAVTDPGGGTGIVAGPGTPGCPPQGSCQIGDVCTSICGAVSGVKVQAYWSQTAGTCVLPVATVEELRLEPGVGWVQADLGNVVQNNPPAFPGEVGGPLFAYVTPTDNIPRVLYMGVNSQVQELRLEPGVGWVQADLGNEVQNNPPSFPAAAGSPILAYVSPDSVPRVLYLG
jgi:hypothetical protein